MIDALYNGISGLNGYQTALNSESNNLANINTVAYKSDNISFADQMYQSQMGKGMKVDTIDKSFAQGNLKITTGTYDMAIKGKGFFIVKGNTEELLYTRAGNFRMAEDGTLKTAAGYNVQGLSATASAVLATDPTDALFTNSYTEFLGSQTIISNNGNLIETINSKTTDFTQSAQNDADAQKGNNYKTREAKIADVEALATAYRSELSLYSTTPVDGVAPTKQSSDITFDTTVLQDNLDSVEIAVGTTTYRQSFDTDAQTTLQKLADQISATQMLQASIYEQNDENANGVDGEYRGGVLNITSMLPGKEIAVYNAKIINGAVTSTAVPVINTTQATIGSGRAKLEAVELELKSAIEDAGAKFLKQSSTVDFSDLENKTIGDMQLKLDSLNIAENPFGTVDIDNGVIYVKEGDNRFVVGKVVTAVFTNELGLEPQGENLFSSTAKSGEMYFATNENEIIANTLELSNSELSESLVDLMVYQRSFEANSKAVTTSDEFLKTAIQLKK
jgi:flagellar hook protein FlgE